MGVKSAVKVLTVLVELLRLVLTVLQGKQWQQEAEVINQTVIGVSLNSYLSFRLTTDSCLELNKVNNR